MYQQGPGAEVTSPAQSGNVKCVSLGIMPQASKRKRRKTIVFILFLALAATVAVLGYTHVLSESVSRTALFAMLAGYLYYRFSGGSKKNGTTLWGIMEGEEEL